MIITALNAMCQIKSIPNKYNSIHLVVFNDFQMLTAMFVLPQVL